MRGPSAPSAIAFVKYAQQYKSDWFDSCLKRRRIPPAKGELLHRYRDRDAWKYYHAGARGKKHFFGQGYAGPEAKHCFPCITKCTRSLNVTAARARGSSARHARTTIAGTWTR